MEILHSKIMGEGTPFIILHGLFGQADNWGSLGRKWSENYQVHLIDVRNHGRSFHDEKMNYDMISQDILSYMNHHSIDKAIVLGHSMGGKAVMQFAMQHPNKIIKLVVADIAPKAYPPHHNAILKGLNSIDTSVLKSRKEAEEVLIQFIPEVGVRQFLLKNLYWTADKTLDWRFNLKALSVHYNEIIGSDFPDKAFDGAVLFLGGEKSKYIVKEDELILKHLFPNYELEFISNSGHWLHAENPKEFYDKVTNFILK